MWRHFDDNNVEVVENVEKFVHDSDSDPYILFYKKIDLSTKSSNERISFKLYE